LDFIKHNLKNLIFPTEQQKKQELWDIEGILHKFSNQSFKFDLRYMIMLENNVYFKEIKSSTKADKIVFDINNKWTIVDVKEMFEYLKKNKVKKVDLENLIINLTWNILIPKNES
jgi:hypothetical protein